VGKVGSARETRTGLARRGSGIGQRQRVASEPRPRPLKGAPNVVGTPSIVGTPVWVVAQLGVLGAAETDGVAGGLMPPRGVSELITGAEEVGLRATDGGLRPPPPSSVEPSGIPTGPTVEPGPIVEAMGGDAILDAAQTPGALTAIPPPSKSRGLDIPVTELPMAADAPVGVAFAMPADVAVIGLPMAADAGVGEAPAHVAPIMGAAPDVVGLTPGVASSVAPRGIPACATAHWQCQAETSCQAPGAGDVYAGLCMRSAAAQERCRGTGNQGGRKRTSVHHDDYPLYHGRRPQQVTAAAEALPFGLHQSRMPAGLARRRTPAAAFR
jgi:hypothetical protein